MTLPRDLVFCLIFAVLAVAAAVPALADDDPPDQQAGPRARMKGRGKPGGPLRPFVALDRDQQDRALEFGRNHHPELAQLLEQLKASDPEQYQRALQDLFRAAERLLRLRERDDERFTVELSLWKVHSRIRLLMAKMVVDSQSSLDEEIKPLLAERRAIRRKLVELERSRTAQRLAELDRELQELQGAGDPERELGALKANFGREAPPRPGPGERGRRRPKDTPGERGASAP